MVIDDFVANNKNLEKKVYLIKMAAKIQNGRHYSLIYDEIAIKAV